jgi:hypothetical protein
LAQDRIERERAEAERKAKTQPIKEAISAIDETRAAILALDQKDGQKASAALERAIGIIEVILAKNPELAQVPLSAEVQIIDFVGDRETVRKMGRQIQALVRDQYYQVARHRLHGFASEINLKTVSLPMSTYPTALRAAARLIGQNKLDDAKADLIAAQTSLMVEERSIPLPLLRAQAILDEVQRQTQQKKMDRRQADRLLADAHEQLVLAEEFRYGSRRQEFNDIEKAIQQVRRDVNRNAGVLARVVSDLQSLREKIF